MVRNVDPESLHQPATTGLTASTGQAARSSHVLADSSTSDVDNEIQQLHQNRVRAWIAAASVGLFALMLGGLFVLILLGVPGDFLAIWLTALSSVAAFALAATSYYRTRPSDGPPSLKG